MTLLVVDDDVVDRRAVVKAIRARRPAAVVLEADTPHAAYALLERGAIDAVLLDYHLPGADGLAVLAGILERQPGVPVVALTGRGDQQVAVAMMKAGARDYLDKQLLTAESLDQSLRHALSMAAADRERRALLAREQAARHQAQAANRAKDEFLATLSHELRTPLNAILGWARLLRAGALDAATAARAMEAIERNAVMQAKLIEDLLDISRVVTGKLQLDLQPLRLSGLVAAAVDSLQHEAAAKSIQLQSAVAGEEVPVLADAARIQQIVGNLLSNALRFTPDAGTVSITVSFDQECARIAVADTGMGIDPSFLPHVFDRFRQAESVATRRHNGLGLGLAIVRHLAELHGGSVRAASDGLGRGALIEVTLPTARNATVAAPSPEAGEDDVPSIAGATVLVVDDDDDARTLMRMVLEQRGARVREAANGREAIAAAAAWAFDIVVSDIAMPELDGYSLIAQLRRQRPDAPFVAIAVTAFASVGDRQRAIEAGFDSHLAKPIDPAVLVAAIGRLHGTRRPAPAP